ncbi:MAG: hypothetical protein ACI89X_004048 [Planctomycetota bacterium]|jgi:hypothetical protein
MRHCRTIPSVLFLATAAHLAGDLTAQQPLAWSPLDRAALEGSSFSHYPLGRHSARVQTLHDEVPGGSILSGHAYRRDAIGVRGQILGFQSDLQVTLSMSPNAANQASSVFANNVGANPVVTLARTILAFPATDRPRLDPAPTWEMMIPYAVPFLVPATGGTLCVDVEVFGNQTATGPNRNVSIYLDAHQQFADGRAVQPGFRTGAGCPAPGSTANCYANLDLWRLANGTTEFDVSIRDGVADTGSGTTRAFLTMGNTLDGTAWPLRADCPFWSSSEVWFALPGTMTSSGDYDGTLANLPLLPPGHRLWCQAGSIDLNTVDMSFSDAITLVTPPSGSLPIPAMRIANGSNQAATSGSVSTSVPVMAFF